MVKIGAKKLILILLGALSTIIFSVAGVSLINYSKQKNSQQSQPVMSVVAWEGNGTETSPYLITSIADLNTLSTNIYNGNHYYNTYFQLTTDLDYSSVDNFCPIGAKMDGETYLGNNFFAGVFDGDGHIVSDLKTTVSSVKTLGDGAADYFGIGFFAAIGARQDDQNTNAGQSIVKNLKIQNYSIQVNKSIDSNFLSWGMYEILPSCFYTYIGGICGNTATRSYWDTSRKIYSVEISNCIVDGLTITVLKSEDVFVGGIVGGAMVYADEDGMQEGIIIKNCIVENINIYNSETHTENYMITDWIYTYDSDKKEITAFQLMFDLIAPAYGIDMKTNYLIRKDDGGLYDYDDFFYDISYCVVTDYSASETYIAHTADYGDNATANVQEDGWYWAWYSWKDISSLPSDWYVSSDRWVYLQTFLTDVYFKAETGGSVSLESYRVPKGRVATSSINEPELLTIWAVTVTATPNDGYAFSDWTISENTYTANFVKYRENAYIYFCKNIYTVDENGNTWENPYNSGILEDNRIIAITYQKYDDNNQSVYKRLSFTYEVWNNVDKKIITRTVTYTIDNDTYPTLCITRVYYKLSEDATEIYDITGETSIEIPANARIYVETELKIYDSNFS